MIYDILPATNYQVTETPSKGWMINNIACSLESGASTGTVVRNSIISVGIESAKTTTCTFRNIRRATLQIIKNATGGTGFFDYSIIPPDNAFGLSVVADRRTGPNQHSGSNSIFIDPGDYKILETEQK